jgi:aspartate aminotransferase
MLNEYRTRRDTLHGWLAADPRLRCRKPAGAFYLFVDISDTLSVDGVRTSSDFAQALLDEARVAVTPGEAFDAPGFVRISYATSMDNLREGSTRMLEFVQKHAPAAARV